ncbi:unnamed protein product [Protopolystoma xenopodis]|uniref:Uncharacterized protein n=1 Tax=Protopolystoma xenopodis TaxID=117903 RepID=A0A448XGB2_9PLAT|nr:unnamed protein product [Protopolystoma xenopodis]
MLVQAHLQPSKTCLEALGANCSLNPPEEFLSPPPPPTTPPKLALPLTLSMPHLTTAISASSQLHPLLHGQSGGSLPLSEVVRSQTKGRMKPD